MGESILCRGAVALAAALLLAWPATAESTDQLARRHMTLCLEGEAEQLWERLSPGFQQQLGGQDRLVAFCGQLGERLGTAMSVLREEAGEVQGTRTWVATVRFDTSEQNWEVQWAFGEGDRVAGFLVRPADPAPSKFADYQPKVRLSLPFEGEWWVFWGGRTVADNYHVMARDQRFAYDLVVMQDGASHKGEGKRNEDYYCWGRPILAPANGTVVQAVDGVKDNVPGEMNAGAPVGNHVVIDHGNDEFSFLAHLRDASVAVKQGAQVTRGQRLGVCGNSGHSSEPHLHFHLQNSSTFGAGDGLPAPFVDYLADGEQVELGEPTRGQKISSAGPRLGTGGSPR